MSKTANYKRKLPILAKLLLERSDEEHPVSRQEMQEELERWGLSAERKSIYDAGHRQETAKAIVEHLQNQL